MAYERKRNKRIHLENTRIIFRPHFTDEPDRFGNTDRYFNVVLDEENPNNTYGYPGEDTPLKIEDLVNDGWNVRTQDGSDGYEPASFIKVKAAYRNRDGSEKRRKPNIIKQIGGPSYKVRMTEDNIAELDEEYIENIDWLDINAYENPQKPGQHSGYVMNMCITVEDDPFARQFDFDIPSSTAPIEEEDDVPF